MRLGQFQKILNTASEGDEDAEVVLVDDNDQTFGVGDVTLIDGAIQISTGDPFVED
jgi:hypothetical protein